MRELLFIAALLFFCAPPLLASDPPIAATSWQITIPELKPQTDAPAKKRTLDLPLIALIVGNHAAAGFDQWSTRRALSRCPNCYEANPLLAPVIHSNVKTALIMQGIIAGVDVLGYYLKRKGVRLWALPFAVKIGAHSVAGINNMRLK